MTEPAMWIRSGRVVRDEVCWPSLLARIVRDNAWRDAGSQQSAEPSRRRCEQRRGCL